MRGQPSLVAFALAAAALGASVPALACSQPECTTPVRLFERDATVPGNLVYFQLLGGVNVDGALQPLSPLTLETAEGEPISARVQTIAGDRVFAPDQAIAPGTHVVLKYRPICHGPEQNPGELEYAFTTGQPFTEVLLTGPSLRITAEGQDEARGETFVKLRYEYDRSVGAAELAHLVDWVPVIDGVRAPLDGDALSTSVTTLCSRSEEVIRDGCDVLNFVPEGEHTVGAKGRIIGFEDLPEVSTSVETRCTAAKAEDGADAGRVDAPEAASSDGCALARRPGNGAFPLLVLLGLCLSRLRTRARRAE